MPQFDPRLAPTRYGPVILGAAAIAISAVAGAGVSNLINHSPAKTIAAAKSAASIKALEHQAFVEAGAPPA